MSGKRVALLLSLHRNAAQREVSEAILALLALLLWAELAAASTRNDHRPVWMRTRPVAGRRPLRLARGSIAGRRARG